MKKTILFSILLMGLALSSCKNDTPIIELKSITIVEKPADNKALVLIVGEKKQLTVTFDPDNATTQKTMWMSEKNEVATVSPEGEITAVANGTAIVKVTVGAVSAQLTIEVKPDISEKPLNEFSEASLLKMVGMQKKEIASKLNELGFIDSYTQKPYKDDAYSYGWTIKNLKQPFPLDSVSIYITEPEYGDKTKIGFSSYYFNIKESEKELKPVFERLSYTFGELYGMGTPTEIICEVYQKTGERKDPISGKVIPIYTFAPDEKIKTLADMYTSFDKEEYAQAKYVIRYSKKGLPKTEVKFVPTNPTSEPNSPYIAGGYFIVQCKDSPLKD